MMALYPVMLRGLPLLEWARALVVSIRRLLV